MNHSTADPGSDTRRRLGALLLAHGITPTRQRIEIAGVLLLEPRHLCAEQVLAEANRAGAAVSKATVYNTLALLARRGLVREVIADQTKVFYDSNTAAHHHFYDTETGRLIDIPEEDIDLGRLPAPPAGKQIEGIGVIVRIAGKSSRLRGG